MKNKIMKKLFIAAFSIILTLSYVSYGFACNVTCAAVCRFTCEFEQWGTCTDAQLDQKVTACCNGAFADTPGINDVPCTVSGGQS